MRTGCCYADWLQGKDGLVRWQITGSTSATKLCVGLERGQALLLHGEVYRGLGGCMRDPGLAWSAMCGGNRQA